VLPVEEPTDVDFAYEDANLVTSGEKMPYLNHDERSVIRAGPTNGEWNQITSRSWQGCVFHVDFNQEELQIVEEVVERVLGSTQQQNVGLRKRLRVLLKDQSESKLLRLSHELQRKLLLREKASIDAFLQDARLGRVSKSPRIQRMGAARPNKAFCSAARISTSEMIRQRELGLQSRRGWKAASTPLSYQMKNNVYDTLGPVCSFTGASSDIHTVAWSPDGQYFAAGAVCITDRDSMQYNRRNNLLYGDIGAETIQELGEHREERARPESGPNSTHEMHVTQDRHLYYTVSSVAFSKNGKFMFSAGYDKTANVWRLFHEDNGERLTQPSLLKALQHKAEVDLLSVSCQDKLATATRRGKRAIKVCSIQENEEVITQTYSSIKSDNRPDFKILPTALQFEPTYGRLLLAGFGANQREDRLDTNGDICLWDIETDRELAVHGSTKNVFDVAWLPNQVETSIFAAGCVAGSNVNRGTRSIVRIYDGRGYEKRTMVIEAECPALDMNDVVVCPYDENLVAAGCTSGRTYVWDLRRPDSFLYALSHGKSLMPLDEYQDREVTDTGVRFLSWGENATRLYTGSSDGVVKVWDVARSLQDVFIKDLVTFDSGIMSGAFTSDKSKLVLGEVNGSVNVLEVGNDDRSIKDMAKLKHSPYEEVFVEVLDVPTSVEDSGKGIAAGLLDSGEMISVPFGGFPIRQAVQGPSYSGPFDQSIDAPYLREQALEFQLSLSQAPGPQCDIPSCRDSIVKVTSEEIGDSGRSTDRIPDELRQQWKLVGSNLTVVSGKSKCTNCGRPARPAETEDPHCTPGHQLCERCHFACFRCGGICRMKPETDKLICQSCFRVWDIGALGYNCVEETGCHELPPGVPSSKGYREEISIAKSFPQVNATFGDEMNALTDYYFSLAIDRPESPPL
jgi:WD40 repeat protein